METVTKATVGGLLIAVLSGFVVMLVAAFLLMWGWNSFIPHVIDGINPATYPQALGAVIGLEGLRFLFTVKRN